MAQIEPTVVQDFIRNRSRIITWENLANGDTGEPVALAGHQDKTVHLFGTFGTCVLQGSNDPTALTDPDNASWVTLKAASGLDISATADTLEVIVENPIYVRPSVTGGDGSTSVKVVICARIV